MDSKKFRPHTLRHQGWNYAASGWYFVTICVNEKKPVFGNIDSEGNMHLNALGKIVEEEWLRTAEVRSNVELDEYRIMPDHFHGILILENEDAIDSPESEKSGHWQKGCLGAIIGRFKEQCTKRIHKAGSSTFMWQRSFYDHVIRNEKDLERIRAYIQENPQAHVFGKEW